MQGVLRINPNSYEDAYVDDPVRSTLLYYIILGYISHYYKHFEIFVAYILIMEVSSVLLCTFVLFVKTGGPDYYVKGVINRNRAFNDDLVVINVLPPDQWEVS